MAQMAQQLNQANFTQAQAGAQGDIANTLKAQQGNQSAALQQGQLVNQAAQGLGTLGNQQMQNNIANYGMLTSAGGFEQQQAQNQINAQLAKFNQAFQYPQQQLGMMESSLGMTPYDTGSSGTSASTTTATQSNPASMALGGLQTLGGLFGSGGAFASGGALSGLFGGSDRRLKTDIQKIGTHSTGLPIYAYRYKGDPKSYPKVAGPMAEDVMKIAPHAVRPMTTSWRPHGGAHADPRCARRRRHAAVFAWRGARDRRARQASGPAAAGRSHAAVARHCRPNANPGGVGWLTTLMRRRRSAGLLLPRLLRPMRPLNSAA